jgi:hypothetical protein
MNALQFIADYNENFGSPGVVRTMQVLTEQFDRLTASEKMLYAEFQEEIAVVLQNNK